MLQNAYFLAKIGADIAENEQHFAEILPIGRRGASSAHITGARDYSQVLSLMVNWAQSWNLRG